MEKVQAEPTESPENRKAGRPRSEESTQAILKTAWNQMLSKPMEEISIEGIAKESGVGKATIYRWWPSKCSLVIDAYIEHVSGQIEFPECTSAAETLRQQMGLLIRAFAGEYGRIFGQIIAEGQGCPERLNYFREKLIYKRRDMVRAIIEQGIANGEFRNDLDIEVAMDILYGPIFYRLLVKHLPLDEAFAENLPGLALRALRSDKSA